MNDYNHIITIEHGKRGGKPCIRGMRITVGDVLGWLAAGMSYDEIFEDFPELTEDDIRACLAFAAVLLNSEKFQEMQDQINFMREVASGLEDYKQERVHSIETTFEELENIIQATEKR